VKIGDFEMGGIGTATLTAIVLYQILSARGGGAAASEQASGPAATA